MQSESDVWVVFPKVCHSWDKRNITVIVCTKKIKMNGTQIKTVPNLLHKRNNVSQYVIPTACQWCCSLYLLPELDYGCVFEKFKRVIIGCVFQSYFCNSDHDRLGEREGKEKEKRVNVKLCNFQVGVWIPPTPFWAHASIFHYSYDQFIYFTLQIS